MFTKVNPLLSRCEETGLKNFQPEFSLEEQNLIIQGVTEDGKKLRPSDWIERICSSMTAFEEQHCLPLSKNIHACIIEGEKCLVFARNLETKNPQAYAFIMSFASVNRLKVIADRRQGDRALGE